MDGPIRGKRKASKNWLKQNQRIRKLHQHIANKRRHYTEVVSKDVATRFQTVAIEDLKVKNMTASAKGDAENPGKKVAQKAGLNRSILNGGFGMFRTRLEAKVKARGGQVIPVNPAYTSQTCPACLHVAKENRPDQATFQCVECGHTNNADINAAQNILLRSLAPEQKIVVSPRRKAERGHQGASRPASLLTEPVAALAQEADTQGALISTAQADSYEIRVKRVKQLDFLLQTAA
jgi:IS605 OrfB family transposase